MSNSENMQNEFKKLKEENENLKEELKETKKKLELFKPYYDKYYELFVDSWIEKQYLLNKH